MPASRSPAPAAEADRATGGVVGPARSSAKKSPARSTSSVAAAGAAGRRGRQILVVGLGERARFDAGTAFRAAAGGSRVSWPASRAAEVAFFLDAGASPARTEAAVAGAMVGCQGQDLYRAEKKRTPPKELLWSGGDAAAIDRGRILGESVNLTRRLVNEPPHDIYPDSFAAKAEEVAKQCGLKVEIWDQARLEHERCGSLLAVASGSNRQPRLVILRYQGRPANDAAAWRSSAKA